MNMHKLSLNVSICTEYGKVDVVSGVFDMVKTKLSANVSDLSVWYAIDKMIDSGILTYIEQPTISMLGKVNISWKVNPLRMYYDIATTIKDNVTETTYVEHATYPKYVKDKLEIYMRSHMFV